LLTTHQTFCQHRLEWLLKTDAMDVSKTTILWYQCKSREYM